MPNLNEESGRASEVELGTRAGRSWRFDRVWTHMLCAAILTMGVPSGAISEETPQTSTVASTIDGLSPAKDPGSGLAFMMPAHYFRRERPSGSTTVAELDGASYSIEVAKADSLYKTEDEMKKVMDETASHCHDRKKVKDIKVHGFLAREWSFNNELGATKIMVVCTPKNYYTCMWHADRDEDRLHKARDTFFSSIDPS